ncbi:hypothetical protein BKA70DRAFT_1500437 [Coprinopsis sp. MPI-PUGE-AT-0042]|nr:hypothetical protein BKA70DRAFT_1500437 [Coprinopsis sp. MPI-PUGE-AT-0042]
MKAVRSHFTVLVQGQQYNHTVHPGLGNAEEPLPYAIPTSPSPPAVSTLADFDTQNAIKSSAFLVAIERPVLHGHLTLRPPYAIHLMDECQDSPKQYSVSADILGNPSMQPASQLTIDPSTVYPVSTKVTHMDGTPTSAAGHLRTVSLTCRLLPPFCSIPSLASPCLASSARSSSRHQLTVMVLYNSSQTVGLGFTPRTCGESIDPLEGVDQATSQYSVKFKAGCTEIYDDISLAQRIPTALKAREPIRKQAHHEPCQRRTPTTHIVAFCRRWRTLATAHIAWPVEPAMLAAFHGVSTTTEHHPFFERRWTCHAAERGLTLPSPPVPPPVSSKPFSAEDLPRKLQSVLVSSDHPRYTPSTGTREGSPPPPPPPPSNGTLAARLTPDYDLHGRLPASLSKIVCLMPELVEPIRESPVDEESSRLDDIVGSESKDGALVKLTSGGNAEEDKEECEGGRRVRSTTSKIGVCYSQRRVMSVVESSAEVWE